MDRLLQFLVDSSGDGLEVVCCANCDLECSKQAGAPGREARVPGHRVQVLAECTPHVLRGLSIRGCSNTSLVHLDPKVAILQVGRLSSRTRSLELRAR